MIPTTNADFTDEIGIFCILLTPCVQFVIPITPRCNTHYIAV